MAACAILLQHYFAHAYVLESFTIAGKPPLETFVWRATACRTGRICGVDEAEKAQSVTDKKKVPFTIQSESLRSFVRVYRFLNVVSCPPAQRAHEQAGAQGGYNTHKLKQRPTEAYVATGYPDMTYECRVGHHT